MTVDHHTALEERIFRAMNADHGPLVDAAARVLSSPMFGAACFIVAAAALWLLRRRVTVLALGAAVALSDLVGAKGWRPLLARRRPCFALPAEATRVLAPASDVGSLPSLHASNFFAMAFVVAAAAGPRAGALAYVVACGVAWSRVQVGVHWPTDVLAGAGWGTLAGALAWMGVRRAAARLRVDRAG